MSLYRLPRNAVVTASAGTGKTHCLVGVLVHLLLGAAARGSSPRGPVDPGRIAATTFSRRAASEIQSRVTLALAGLAAGDPSAPFAAELDESCKEALLVPLTTDERALRARRALVAVGRLQVGTVHSLAARIVGAHSFEAGVSPGFEFADEKQSHERAVEIVTRVLAAHAGEPEVRLLERLVEDGRDADALLIADDESALERTFGGLVEHARGLAADPALGEPA